MTRFISVITILLYTVINLFSQEPLIIWDNITFNCVKIPEIENTVIKGMDTLVKGRLIPRGSPWIRLSGRIINNKNTTQYLRKDISSTSSFKIEYLYRKKKFIIDLDYQFISGYSDDIILPPGKGIEIVLESHLPFKSNTGLYKIDKNDYLKEILELLPTIIIKSQISIDEGDIENIINYYHVSDNVTIVTLNWDNYIPYDDNLIDSY